jgi:hypothetical protein
MLFCHLAQSKSLREITEGLQASEGKLKHLGLPEAPARSTLAYANSHRPWRLYEPFFTNCWLSADNVWAWPRPAANSDCPAKC